MRVWAEKLKRLSEVLRGVEKQFGRGAAVRIDEAALKAEGGGVPTGSLGLDVALGGSGYPRGRITELCGHESSGKTSVALQSIAAVQAAGGTAAFVDADHALDLRHACNLGIQPDKLLLIRTSAAEEAWGIMERLLREDAVDLLVVDSLSALISKAELETELSDGRLHARMLSHSIRKLLEPLAGACAALLLLNRLHAPAPGDAKTTAPGDAKTATSGDAKAGGNFAVKMFSSIRCHIENLELLKCATQAVGIRARASILKNKCAAPAEPVEFALYFKGGICQATEALEWGLKRGRLEKRAEGIFEGELLLGKTREEALAALKTRPEAWAGLVGG